MFLVDDGDRVVRFYEDVFDVKLFGSLPVTLPFEWVYLRLGEIEVVFLEEGAQREYRVS